MRPRKVITHRCLIDGDAAQFKTLKDWNADPSTKINLVCKIVQHHLSKDGAAPLELLTRSPDNVLTERNVIRADPPCGVCDKLVIFSIYIPCIELIAQVSHFISETGYLI